MTLSIGRNRNTNDTATVTEVTVNSTDAVTLVPANPNRTALIVTLNSGLFDISVFVRLYAAATDNLKKGILLNRVTSGNDTFDMGRWQMLPDNIYTGEISAIAESGTINLHITEY